MAIVDIIATKDLSFLDFLLLITGKFIVGAVLLGVQTFLIKAAWNAVVPKVLPASRPITSLKQSFALASIFTLLLLPIIL